MKKITILILAATSLVACKKSLDVTEGPDYPSLLGPSSNAPTVALPASSPYYSSTGNLLIKGLCKRNSKVILSGADSQEVLCDENGSYEFTVNKASDGNYSFNLQQVSGAVQSKIQTLFWVKKSSVSAPALTTPNSNPYFSALDALNVQGGCETGAQIRLAGAATGTTTCVNSQFSINVLKFVDGDYAIDVIQKDLAGNEATSSFTWKKQALVITPTNPQVVVTQSQVFNFQGGANSYTANFTENNSGGAYDVATKTYTAGTVGNVVDRIEISDGQGFSQVLEISVISDVADHFEFPTASGNNQTQLVGRDFNNSIVAKVVDRFGNAVRNFAVVFQKTAGDLFIKSNTKVTTDNDGLASIQVQQGFSASRSYISVAPETGVLPDVNSTGNVDLSYLALGQSLNTRKYGFSFAVGGNPDKVLSADLTGDGNTDFLVLNKSDLNISVLSGSATGRLNSGLPKILGLCSGASSMEFGQFTADTNLDLVVSCSGTNQYAFIKGRGNGTFDPAVNRALDATENVPVDLAVQDFNEDGFADFAMISATTNQLAVRMGNNDGTFAAPSLYTTMNFPTKVIAVDVDNTNGVDLVVLSGSSNQLSVYLNNGSGSFGAPTAYSTGVAPSDIVSADFNGNGFADLAVSNNTDGNVSVFMNAGDGTYNAPINTAAGTNPTSIEALDFNSDGVQDLFVTNSGDHTLSVLLGSGNGNFGVQPSITTLLSPINMVAVDFNGDGLKDLAIVSNGENRIELVPNQGNAVMGFRNNIGSPISKVISADVDQDGVLDQIVLKSSANRIQILKGDGKGLFSPFGSELVTANNPVDAAVADFNYDGILDIVVANSGSGGVQVFLGQAGGAFNLGQPYPTGNQPTAIELNDFNRDGFIDIAVTNSGANQLAILPGLGDGTFGARLLKTTSSQPYDLVSGDFNLDKKIDIAVVNQSSNNVEVFIANGDGTFQDAVAYSVQQSPNGIVAGYLDSDGHLDLAISNFVSGTVSVLKGSPTGAFGAAVNFTAGTNPVSLSKGDFNGNGREDLVVCNGVNQKMTFLYGNPTGDFSFTEEFTINLSSSSVHVFDANNDGALDFAVGDSTNNVIKNLLGH